ncbi:MAG: hypothetical protein Q9219_007692, partial [cf. Caloplaca sp. 3 TL-2023]
KRASVAVIIRVRPAFSDRSSFDAGKCGLEAGNYLTRLESFFSQEWVQRGEPEVLFIKRAAREGDRWTSHIAFPGGRRDPGDKDDEETSIRETKEEIGLDLEASHYLLLGIMSDFLRTIPSCDTSDLWAWPTLSPIDFQFVIWVLTYTYRKQKMRKLTSTIITTDKGSEKAPGFGDLDNSTFTTLHGPSRQAMQDSELLDTLGGYYDRAKLAVFCTVMLRLVVGSLCATWAFRQLLLRDPNKLSLLSKTFWQGRK